MSKKESVCIMAAIIHATPDANEVGMMLDTQDSVTRALSIVDEVESRLKEGA